MIGQKLSHYRIEEELGKGGMGIVYRATDSKLGREVAIKVLPPAVVNDAERLTRFEHEARRRAEPSEHRRDPRD
jgi:serine/threonine protein kinase